MECSRTPRPCGKLYKGNLQNRQTGRRCRLRVGVLEDAALSVHGDVSVVALLHSVRSPCRASMIGLILPRMIRLVETI